MLGNYKQNIKKLISNETYLLPVKTIGSVTINVALVYPNTYGIGMSNLGFHSIYYQINLRDDALCHRAFLCLENNRKCNINTVEADKSINEYDIVGFSISFEMDYINILKILDSMQIPIFSENRQTPLVMAGGPAATFNPEPLSPFVDIFVIGEGEEVIHEIIQKYKEYQNRSKQEILEALAQIKGVYVPIFYNITYDKEGKVQDVKTINSAQAPIAKRWIKDINKYNTESVILTPYTEFKEMFLIEVSGGVAETVGFVWRVTAIEFPAIDP